MPACRRAAGYLHVDYGNERWALFGLKLDESMKNSFEGIFEIVEKPELFLTFSDRSPPQLHFPCATWVRAFVPITRVSGGNPKIAIELSAWLYLPMILNGHDAIAGLDLKCTQIRWITRDYPALRAENFVCRFTPSANAIKCD